MCVFFRTKVNKSPKVSFQNVRYDRYPFISPMEENVPFGRGNGVPVLSLYSSSGVHDLPSP